MSKKLVFFDIDGTLAMPGDPPTAAVIDAIRRLRQNGHLAFLSTGRAEVIVPDEIRAIGFDGGIFSAGGRNTVGDREISSHPMPESLTRRIMEILDAEEQLFYILESASGNYCGNAEKSGFGRVETEGASTELMRIMQVFMNEKSLRAEDWKGEPIFKVSWFCMPRSRMDRVSEALSKLGKVVRFDNMVPDSPLVSAEITAEGTDKGRAIQDICRYCGADIADSIAFGDSMNDAEMLIAAGTGVAMGNAEPRVKELADRVCESCVDDGIVRELERMKLI